MPKFIVTVQKTEESCYEVEAEDQQSASRLVSENLKVIECGDGVDGVTFLDDSESVYISIDPHPHDSPQS